MQKPVRSFPNQTEFFTAGGRQKGVDNSMLTIPATDSTVQTTLLLDSGQSQ